MSLVKDELASLYQGEGAVGMNAFTSEDVTFYINQLPANKLELWCWVESDRLANSVFREFFSERDVVHEERRMRTESSPTGEFQEQFNSMFWQASPYSWPVIGWPSDLNSYTLEEANRYFDIYYQPANLVGVVVGDFELEPTKAMIREYFGALEARFRPSTAQFQQLSLLKKRRSEWLLRLMRSLRLRFDTTVFPLDTRMGMRLKLCLVLY